MLRVWMLSGLACVQITDKSIPFMPRTEVIDVRSGAHLGHVFNGESHTCLQRYCKCIRSLACMYHIAQEGHGLALLFDHLTHRASLGCCMRFGCLG